MKGNMIVLALLALFAAVCMQMCSRSYYMRECTKLGYSEEQCSFAWTWRVSPGTARGSGPLGPWSPNHPDTGRYRR